MPVCEKGELETGGLAGRERARTTRIAAVEVALHHLLDDPMEEAAFSFEDADLDLEGHNKQLEKWEYEYNYIRPLQALACLTPYEYYRQWKQNHKAQWPALIPIFTTGDS